MVSSISYSHRSQWAALTTQPNTEIAASSTWKWRWPHHWGNSTLKVYTNSSSWGECPGSYAGWKLCHVLITALRNLRVLIVVVTVLRFQGHLHLVMPIPMNTLTTDGLCDVGFLHDEARRCCQSHAVMNGQEVRALHLLATARRWFQQN